jgi:hypothetical protein
MLANLLSLLKNKEQSHLMGRRNMVGHQSSPNTVQDLQEGIFKVNFVDQDTHNDTILQIRSSPSILLIHKSPTSSTNFHNSSLNLHNNFPASNNFSTILLQGHLVKFVANPIIVPWIVTIGWTRPIKADIHLHN